MSATALKLTLHVVLCAAIFWSCFCRQTKSSARTTREIGRASCRERV